jgi:hypothetical protein
VFGLTTQTFAPTHAPY